MIHFTVLISSTVNLYIYAFSRAYKIFILMFASLSKPSMVPSCKLWVILLYNRPLFFKEYVKYAISKYLISFTFQDNHTYLYSLIFYRFAYHNWTTKIILHWPLIYTIMFFSLSSQLVNLVSCKCYYITTVLTCWHSHTEYVVAYIYSRVSKLPYEHLERA